MNNIEFVINSIGNTPIIKISPKETTANFFVKCEYVNPSGSHKDRMYNYGIKKFEGEGIIRKGMTLVDYSSGNAGAALALLASIYGYKSLIVRPSDFSKGKAKQIINYGGEIIEVPKKLGIRAAREKAIEITNRLNGNAYMMYQTDSVFNIEAFTVMADEIVTYFKKNHLELDAFVCPVGTGGTFTSLGRTLKRVFKDIMIFAVDIEEAPQLYNLFYSAKRPIMAHNIEGMSVGEVFSNTDLSIIDEVLIVSAEKSWAMAKILGKEYQFFLGPSSGAGFFSSIEISKKLKPNANILTIFWDQGWKYY
jgi:cysteine synthase